MGCWNGTCGISNLPILHGERIVLFIIQKARRAKTNSGGFVYPWDQYAPITIGVHGTYNDYGGIEEITKNGKLVFNHLSKKNLVAIDDKVGEQPADIEELINDYIERGEYEDIGFMMVREDIYNHLMNAVYGERDQYVRGAQSFKDSYTAQNKNDYNDELTLRAELEKLGTMTKEQIEVAVIRSKWKTRDFYQYGGHDNPFTRAISSYEGGWFHLRDLVWELADSRDKDLETALIDLIMMDYILFPLRKAWQLQTGAGSQADETELHIELAKKVIEVAGKISRFYDDDEEDE